MEMEIRQISQNSAKSAKSAKKLPTPRKSQENGPKLMHTKCTINAKIMQKTTKNDKKQRKNRFFPKGNLPD